MRSHMILVAAAAFLLASAGPTLAESTATSNRSTAQWMLKQESIWANMACGGKWLALDTFADGFKGTLPNGTHYGKPKSIPTYGPDTKWATNCHLDSAEVHFYSPDVAVVFGAESKTVTLKNSKHQRRYLVWTDTWLKRNGQWQMIAAQDSRIDCPVRKPAPNHEPLMKKQRE